MLCLGAGGVPDCSWHRRGQRPALEMGDEILNHQTADRAASLECGAAVMRLHDRHLLERLCESLEWTVIQKERQRSRNGLG